MPKKCLKMRIRAYYRLLVRNKIRNLAKIDKKRPLFWLLSGLKTVKNMYKKLITANISNIFDIHKCEN